MSLLIKNLKKSYGTKVALEELDLEIKPGIFGLIGPNGAGKTTLMKILATLLQPDMGSVSFQGVDLLRQPDKIRTILGYLPQKFGYYPNLTAVDFLDYLLLFYQITSPIERERRIESVLENVGLQEVRQQKLKTYSGGMIQRLGIAQALLNEPKLLIVDEPAAGLDPEERVRFRQLLSKLVQSDPERVVIISTHIINDIANCAQQIGILKNGELLYSGSPANFIKLNQGQIWEVNVEDEDIEEFQQRYTVLNFSSNWDFSTLMIITTEPPAGAVPVTPDLEDAYFAFMRGDTV